MSNIRERLRMFETGLWVRPMLRMPFIRCVFRDGCKRFLHCPLSLHLELVARSTKKRLASHSLIYPVPTTLPMCFSWAMFFCQDVTDHCTLAGSADSPLFICRDHSTPPLLGSKHGMGSLGLRWSYADFFWVLVHGVNCTNVHLARLIAGV